MGRSLPATIESVLHQDYADIEYIVVDGGSSDGTIQILEGYRDRLRYSSGPDDGPPDAIHKGLAEARGEILAWLNADDTYERGAVRRAVEYLSTHPDVDVVYGDGWWITDEGKPIRKYPSMPFDSRALERDCFICQPAAFLRASSYRACPLDPRQKMSFDYDLWIRMAAQGIQFAYLREHLANTRMDQHALTLSARDGVFRSSIALLSRHYNYVPFSWVFGYTAFRMDGRDQFFEPLQPSLTKYLASLPLGLSYNRRKPFQYLGEWLRAPWQAIHNHRHRSASGGLPESGAGRPAHGDKMSLR
jgi:glycosyltransferase involved in cell wall biosynthesis